MRIEKFLLTPRFGPESNDIESGHRDTSQVLRRLRPNHFDRSQPGSKPNFKLTYSQNYGKLDAAFPAGTRVPAGP
jgi:hypothetical protein